MGICCIAQGAQLYGDLEGWDKGWGGKELQVGGDICIHIADQSYGSDGKNLPAVQETWIRSLGREDPPEKRMATHSSILAWEIP